LIFNGLNVKTKVAGLIFITLLFSLARNWPAYSRQRLNQGGAFDFKITAHGSLRHAVVINPAIKYMSMI